MGTCHTGIQSDGVPKYLRENLVATVDANRLAIRSQTETNNVAVPEPGDGEHDAKKRQQHAEDDKGFAARDRRDEPVEVHPEKASERGDGQEDRDTSVRRLICSPCLRAISAEKSWMMFDIHCRRSKSRCSTSSTWSA